MSISSKTRKSPEEPPISPSERRYFPLAIDLAAQRCLVVGAVESRHEKWRAF